MKRIDHRFWAKVTQGTPEQCWPWTGYKKSSGHGLTTLDSFVIHASRKAWILTKGPIRGGLSVNHTCDNAACCNPGHMYLGTRADNMIDRFSKTFPTERGARSRATILTDEQLERLWQMRRQGATLKACAAQFGVHMRTIARYITQVRKQKLVRNRADKLSRVAHVGITSRD